MAEIQVRRKRRTRIFRVSAQHVTLGAGGKAVWGKVQTRRVKSTNLAEYIRNALTYAHRILNRKQIGTVVSINDIPVYHTKWGNDGYPFYGWKDNPTAQYWKRSLKK